MFLNEKEINWRLLRVQKIIMLRLAEEDNPRLPLTRSERYSCNCMIGLLDYLQDQAEETCSDTPKSDIFTHVELEEDFEEIGIEFDGNVDNARYHLVDKENNWLDAFVTREKAEIQKKNIEENTSIGWVTILPYVEYMIASRSPDQLPEDIEFEYYCPQCYRIWDSNEPLPPNLTCELHSFIPLSKRQKTKRG